MSNIRVNYSGLIAFVVGILGVLLSLTFTLIITRKLTPEDFGIWSLLFSIINYFLISEVVVSYWTTRQIARGDEVGRTSLFSSLSISGLCIPIFILYTFVISQNNDISYEILLLGLILLPVMFVSQTLTGINLGYKPHVTSYSLLVFGILKIPLALLTVVIFDWGVIGIILAIFISTVGKITLQVFFALPKLKISFNFYIFRQWSKLSWIPIFAKLQNYIQLLDIVLYSIIINSVIGIAYYNAAFTVSHIVTHASAISQALFPKLLANKDYDGIVNNLKLLFYFAIPLVTISIIFSKPMLFALNPLYQDAWPVVLFLSLKVFMHVTRVIPISIILGLEQVDLDTVPHFSNIIKSSLFRLPVILGIFNFIYIGILVIVLSLFNSKIDEFQLVLWWSIIGFVIEVPMTLIIWIFSRKFISFSLPWKKISKSIFASLIVMIQYYFTSKYILNYEISIYDFLPTLILQLIISLGIYTGITFVIDKEVKILFKTILKKIF